MLLSEMKEKVLGMIEEINPDSAYLTDDPDIQAKINDVINQVMFELSRIRKLPDYVEMEVKEGDMIRFSDIKAKAGREVYQLGTIRGVDYELKAGGTIIKAMEDGTAEIDYYCYPEAIHKDTPDTYEFEVSMDILEIMPYGVAADILKSDVSTNYGSVYSQRYETMIQRIDPRYSMGSITFEGGIDI